MALLCVQGVYEPNVEEVSQGARELKGMANAENSE